jgi:hypothetical protein
VGLEVADDRDGAAAALGKFAVVDTQFLDLAECLCDFIGFHPGCILTAGIGMPQLECNRIVLIDRAVLGVLCQPYEEFPGQAHEIEGSDFYSFAAMLFGHDILSAVVEL